MRNKAFFEKIFVYEILKIFIGKYLTLAKKRCITKLDSFIRLYISKTIKGRV